MERKINQVGTGTLTVSLPSKWVKKNRLKKGDMIHLDQQGRNLIMSPRKISKIRTRCEVHIPSMEKYSKRLFSPYFRKGYDEIKVTFKDPEILGQIEKDSQRFLGMEIVEQGRNYCLIKNLAQGVQESMEHLMKRLLFVSQSMAQDLYKTVRSGNFEKLKSLKLMDDLASKLEVFIKRVVNTTPLDSSEKIGHYYLISSYLENTIDYYVCICTFLIKNKVRFSKAFFDYFKMQLELHELYNKVYSGATIDNLTEFRNMHKKMKNAAMELTKTLSKGEIYLASMLFAAGYALEHAAQHYDVE